MRGLSGHGDIEAATVTQKNLTEAYSFVALGVDNTFSDLGAIGRG